MNISVDNSQNISISGSTSVSLGDVSHLVSGASSSPETVIDRNALANLLQDLVQELRTLPADKAQDAEAIATLAQELSDKASKDNPNPRLVNISAAGLVDAAKSVADVAPKLLDISSRVASLVAVLL